MSSTEYFTCSFCNAFYASSPNQLRNHVRHRCMASPYRNLRAIQSSRSSVPMAGLEAEDTVESMDELTGSPSMDNTSGQFLNIDADIEMDSVSPGPSNSNSRVYQFRQVEEMGPIKTAAMKIFNKAEEFGVPRQFQRDLAHILNNEVLNKLEAIRDDARGTSFPTPDTTERSLRAISKDLGLVKLLDVCPNGCFLYGYSSSEPAECPHCHASRYLAEGDVPVRRSAAKMSVVSVGAVLAERLMNEDSHSLYLYRDRYEREVHDEGIYRDIFSGSVYRDQWQNQGMFANPGDVGLLIVVDGFQPKHKNKATMTTICGYIMTMEPTERYKDENVITFAVIPGPKKPANLMSFLDPILSEIKDLGEHGFDIKKNGESIFCGKVYLMGITGDIPGIAELMNHHGHNCLHGCRFCDTVADTTMGHAYFPGSGNLRTRQDLIDGRSDLHMDGVSSVITSMPTFSGPFFFGMDEMHLIARGIGSQVYHTIKEDGHAKYGGTLEYPFEFVAGYGMADVAKYMELSKATIPECFEGCFDGCFGTYRAVDWEDFLATVVPCIALQYIASNLAKIKLMDLINACNISMARELRASDLILISE